MRKHLKIARLNARLMQDELARKVGVSRTTYARVERGVLPGSERMWLALADVLHAPVEKLREIDEGYINKMVVRGGYRNAV